MGSIALEGNFDFLDVAEQVPVECIKILTTGIPVVELFQLANAQGATHLINAVVKPQGDDIVTAGRPRVAIAGAGGHTMGAQKSDLIGQGLVIGCHHATFAGSHVFVAVETEAA